MGSRPSAGRGTVQIVGMPARRDVQAASEEPPLVMQMRRLIFRREGLHHHRAGLCGSSSQILEYLQPIIAPC